MKQLVILCLGGVAYAAMLTGVMAQANGPYPYPPQGYGQQPGYPQQWGYPQRPGTAGPWIFKPQRQPAQPMQPATPPQPTQQLPQPAQTAQPNGGPGRGYSYSYSYSSRNGRPPVVTEQSRTYGQPQSRGYGQPQTRQSTQPPHIEEELSSYQPYTQESVIYTVRIVSGENLKTVDVTLPKSDAVIFKKLDGPSAKVRTRGGRQEIVNEFRYALIPLKAGNLSLPPIRISGNMAGSPRGFASDPEGREFDAQGERNLSLQVRPAAPGVQPWLPLQHLALRTELQGAEQPEEGKPFTLVATLSAVGATGSQLPSLEKQLQSSDFRIYREKTSTSGGMSADGRYLQGVRQEQYTLVPQYGGKLQLPELRVSWWNVTTGTLQHASQPTQPLSSSGSARDGGLFGFSGASTLFPAGSSSVFWIPLAAVFGLLIGYWLAVWLREDSGEGARPTLLTPLWLRLRVFGGAVWRFLGPRLGRLQAPLAEAGSRFGPASAEFRARTRAQLRRLSPAPYWLRVRDALIRALPQSLRFWFCVRGLDKVENPETWSKQIKTTGYVHLDLAPQAPLSAVGDKILSLQPKVDAAEVRRLIRGLDGAIYGGEQVDFPRWKKAFAAQVRPRIVWGRSRRSRNVRGLPALNPKLV